mmetsp:Transcript_3764/g.13177  ORF Transcript_3764/g.13177 Transcript_3764/m.13177 type:complete len:91 (+) Transcript_3764:163-435(+)
MAPGGDPAAGAPSGTAETPAPASAGVGDDPTEWCTSGGSRHIWERWHEYTPVKKYRCVREGCGYFKKCWLKCATADTTCNGCHVIGHKRW